MLRLIIRQSFSKLSSHSERLIQIQNKINHLNKQYKIILKQELSLNRNSRLLHHSGQLDKLYAEKKKIREQKIKDQELNIVKEYLASKVVEPNKEESERYIPAGLTLNKLEHKGNTVLLIGISKKNQEHGMFVQDLVKRLDIKLLMTQLPADWPYFIKATQTFENAWHKFLTLKSQYSFYLNPKPSTLAHIILDRHKLPLFKQTLMKSSSFTELSGICVELNNQSETFQANSFLSGLFCPKLQNLVCFDYPMLRQRQFQALTMNLQSLRDLFRTYLYKVEEGNIQNFDPRLLHYDKMLKPRIQYMTRVIKLGSTTFPKTIAVCDHQYSHLICDEWKNPLPKNSEIFNFPNINTSDDKKKRGFIEHLQKLVILDTILSPLVSDFFMKHNVFPFKFQHFVGGSELLPSVNMLWDFYMKKYRDAVANNIPIQYPSNQRIT